jgi:four helix bundle protein
MKYTRFEDLPVWQASMQLCERVFALTENKAFAYKGDLRSQMQRAAISVGNNIAEGFERGTTQELLTFLYIARGSAGEVRSMLLLAERLPAFANLKSEISDTKSVAESISRQVRAWADSLQNSDFSGARYVTDKSRQRVQQKTASDEFWAKIDRTVEEAQAKRLAAHAGLQGGSPGPGSQATPET